MFTKTKKLASYIFIYGLVNKSVILKLNEDINAQKEALKETQIIIANSAVNFSFLIAADNKKMEQIIDSNLFEGFLCND